MTDDDSVRITAMSLARRRALAGVRTGEIPLGAIPDVIVCGHRRRLIPGSRRERLTARNEIARKWRRNGLKRLNPGPEMVWARKPRTYNIWYPGARQWRWFILCQIAFGAVAGFVVNLTERVHTLQHLPFAVRSGIEAPGLGERREDED